MARPARQSNTKHMLDAICLARFDQDQRTRSESKLIATALLQRWQVRVVAVFLRCCIRDPHTDLRQERFDGGAPDLGCSDALDRGSAAGQRQA